MKRILLITHDASRTGAPMVVLHFARWLRAHRPEVGVDVLAVKGGALADDLKKVADTYSELVMPPLPRMGLGQRALNKALRLAGIGRSPSAAEWKEQELGGLAGRGYDVIHANSLVSIPIGARIKELSAGQPLLVAHIHELEMVIRQVLPDLPLQLMHVDRVWAGSGLVREGLLNTWGVPSGKVDVQYPCTVVNAPAALGLPEQHEGFHVVGLGSVVLRKGYDLFIQVAAWVRRHHPELNVRFTWGGPVSEYDRPLIDHDITMSGLSGHVQFIGGQSDPAPLYAATDVFLLPSREDPFPLVCIEVGAMGKPIICFEGATGTAEVLRHGGGRIVPYLDIAAMGQAVVDYALDPDRRKTDGDLNRAQFAKFGPDQQCPLMLQRIEVALARKAAQA
jgi:glycosyltransferase involved in cell wall biosynthesis